MRNFITKEELFKLGATEEKFERVFNDNKGLDEEFIKDFKPKELFGYHVDGDVVTDIYKSIVIEKDGIRVKVDKSFKDAYNMYPLESRGYQEDYYGYDNQKFAYSGNAVRVYNKKNLERMLDCVVKDQKHFLAVKEDITALFNKNKKALEKIGVKFYNEVNGFLHTGLIKINVTVSKYYGTIDTRLESEFIKSDEQLTYIKQLSKIKRK